MPRPTPKKSSASAATPPAASSRSGMMRIVAGGAAVIGLGATIAALARRTRANPAEHAAPDLALDRPRPGAADRAPDAFRPDPTAPVPAGMRESLRPATGPAPTIVAGHDSGRVH